MRFWRDAFIFVGVLSLIIAGMVIITTSKHLRLKAK
jgi:hypothetical protein